MNENKFRLVMKGEVVGYEKDVECSWGYRTWVYSVDLGGPFCPDYIRHTTKDRFVGEFNDVKVWERDRVKRKDIFGKWETGVIVWHEEGSIGWIFQTKTHCQGLLFKDALEVIGRAKEAE